MNNTLKHTPGPWTIQDLGQQNNYPNWHSFAVRSAQTNVHLATVGNVDRYYEGQEGANAKLIAAAPDLLEACKAALPLLEQTAKSYRSEWPDTWEESHEWQAALTIKSAIAKAESL